MKKICFLFTLIIGIIFFYGCKDSNSYVDATNYNCFNRIYLFSSGDSTIEQHITQESNMANMVTRDVLGTNTEKCFINDCASEGLLGEGNFYNDFYLYDYNTGELELLNFGENIIDNTVYIGTMNESQIVLLDVINEILYVYDLTTEKWNKKNKMDLDMPSGISLKNVAQITCDKDYIYLTFGIDEMDLCILDFDLNLLSHKTAKEFWKLYPNIAESCLIGDGKKEFYNFEENNLKDTDYKIGLSEEELPDYTYIYPGDEKYDFYYVNEPVMDENGNIIISSNLIGVKGREAYKIMDFGQMGLSGEMIYPVISQGNGNYMIGHYNMAEGTQEYYLFEKYDEAMDYSLNKGKEVIRIVGYSIPSNLKNVSFAFNNSSKEYCIELIEYCSKYQDPADAWNALYLDVAVSKEADAVLLYGLDKTDLENKDILLDLNEYFSSGHIISGKDFEPFIWENMQNRDGTIYSVYPEFTVAGFMSAQIEDINDLANYKTIVADGQTLFTDGYEMYNFTNLLKYSGNRFIDTETGELNFDEDFINLLEILKEESIISNVSENNATAILEEEVLGYYDEMVIPYSYFYNMYLFDSEFTCINYGVNSPILVPSMMELGIMNYTNNKEGMFAFLDYIFSDEIYSKFFGELSFPVLSSYWDDWMFRIMATENYTDRFGDKILAGSYSYGMSDVVITIGSVSSENASAMKEMISSAQYVEPLNQEYLAIIEEEVLYYLNDKKSVEEVCGMMENRLSVALAE